MKYNYNSDLECFEREDKLGKKLWVNNVEAQRIVTLYQLGNSIPMIRNKITFHSRKVTESTIENFLKNYHNGDIVLPDIDYVPVNEDLTIEQRISNLESEVEELKGLMSSDDSFTDKIRGLFKNG